MVVNCGNFGLKPPKVGAFLTFFGPFKVIFEVVFSVQTCPRMPKYLT